MPLGRVHGTDFATFIFGDIIRFANGSLQSSVSESLKRLCTARQGTKNDQARQDIHPKIARLEKGKDQVSDPTLHPPDSKLWSNYE
jgi:hypothetical protein